MNGICTNNSTASMPLANNTATGANGAGRQASQAAVEDGTATDANSQTPGRAHGDSPSGARSETGGVKLPVSN
jgi:hypothetical protein